MAGQRDGAHLMGAATLGVFNLGTAAAGANVHDITEAGTGSITIPGSVTSVTIQVWGAGGGGGFSILTSQYNGYVLEIVELPGGGGGGGGYSKSVIALTGADTGKTILYVVGAGGGGGSLGEATGGGGGQSLVYSGTYSLTSLAANGGNGGSSGEYGGAQGTGGTASGGNTTNTTGNGSGIPDPAGATPRTGDNGLTAGGGGDAGEVVLFGQSGLAGYAGRVRIAFT